ncbi:hypothetical protein AARI_19190 [Glutamicibacter arilaitensis Re117]|uniref:Uncharacterized protein n=1 Tax=Glutamicibacter arilaitensis (strain DSM 16368 / CIP 108037 / IAM 15318 / JCM 13566 / NCIMB 14258 / Re117) TaxID=861360 RepID=A0ABM9PXT7_GLUAR|nr:hypothetical protein AARI_19190 [Glutamicibacter arilaitensis Re117]
MIQTMVIHYTQRISWPDLPAELRELIESHCETWCSWSGTGWQDRDWPSRLVIVTHLTRDPLVSFLRLVQPWGGRPVPVRPTSVT